MFDLLNCRTAYLGGHIDRCDNCGTLRIVYHSCRNRHCPRCQHMPRERWLAQRKDEILATSYFHVVFTLPHELNAIILNNKKVMLNILFKAASRTLLTFGENEMGGQLGFIATLHTWDQQLKAHFHLHCLVAGGVVAKDGLSWKPCKGDYLFNKEALGLVFRGKFLDFMCVCEKPQGKCALTMPQCLYTEPNRTKIDAMKKFNTMNFNLRPGLSYPGSDNYPLMPITEPLTIPILKNRAIKFAKRHRTS